MGNICNGNIEKDENTETVDTVNKNAMVCQFALRQKTKIELVLGSYRSHKSSTLLAIASMDQLDYCSELRDYAYSYSSTLGQITSSRKTLNTIPINKQCPYKKVIVCVLPVYYSDEAEEYQQIFLNAIKELLPENNDLTLQVSHTTENSNGLPNQMLIALMVRCMQSLQRPMKVALISSEQKLLQLIRFQLMKTQDCELKYLLERQ